MRLRPHHVTALLLALSAPGWSLDQSPLARGVCVALSETRAHDFQARFHISYLAHNIIEPDIRTEISEIYASMRDHYQVETDRFVAESGGPERAKAKAFADIFGRRRVDNARLAALYGEDIQTGKSASISIRRINDQVRNGAFAATALHRGDFIGEYTGVLQPYRPDADNSYQFGFGQQAYTGLTYPDRSTKYVIDAKASGSYMRFINHSAQPNVEVHYVFSGGEWHIILVAAHDVAMDDQLTFDYGDRYWESQGMHPSELTR